MRAGSLAHALGPVCCPTGLPGSPSAWGGLSPGKRRGTLFLVIDGAFLHAALGLQSQGGCAPLGLPLLSLICSCSMESQILPMKKCMSTTGLQRHEVAMDPHASPGNELCNCSRRKEGTPPWVCKVTSGAHPSHILPKDAPWSWPPSWSGQSWGQLTSQGP